MILKVMTEDGYSIYPNIGKMDFYSAAKAEARYWSVARPKDRPFDDAIFVRTGAIDELAPAPVNFMHAMIPDEGKQSVCVLFAEYLIDGAYRLISWAFNDAYLMDDSGRTIEHLF